MTTTTLLERTLRRFGFFTSLGRYYLAVGRSVQR
jgi:hypothetical protein